jgi:outer membrane murein-binding lipoprotein Lpp
MITNLSNQVLALQTTVQANNATISRLTTDITALNVKVYALIEEIDKINS